MAPNAQPPLRTPRAPARRRIRVPGLTRLAAFLRIDAARNGRGSLSPAVAILAVMIFTLAGLVIDGGRHLGAKSRAVGYAQEAARVGAASIELNTDEAKIDTAKAGTAVAGFCDQVKSNDPAVQQCGTTELTNERLRVSVVLSNRTTFLGMIGINQLDAGGVGEAHAEQGIKKADETPEIPPIVVIPTSDGPGSVGTTIVPPTLDVPCPTWTVGSPSPTPTWTEPIPFPTTCKENFTPTPTPDPPDTNKPPNTNKPTNTPPGGGQALPTAVPNSQPPSGGR